MTGKAVALDPGSHSYKVLRLEDGKRGLVVKRFGVVPEAEGAAALARLAIPLQGAVVGLAGRDMTLRYTQVPPAPDWQLKSLMELEMQDVASQSGGELSGDYNLLPAVAEEGSDTDTVLLALARNDALERVAETVRSAGGSVAGYVPNCIALYNVWLRTRTVGDDKQLVCLMNIGHSTTDIALVRGQDLLFARNLTGGSKVLDDALERTFNVSSRKAESLKRDLLDLDPASRGRYASGQAEKVTVAAGGAGSVLVSAVQSSLAFCQAQTKVQGLRLDQVLLCGGGARLRGVCGMLREALRCPVELFDAFANVDLSALPAEDAKALEESRSEAVVALGLAISKTDPDVYTLEILPEGVKRKQRFWRRTVFNIAAGAVGVGLLAVNFSHSRADLDAALVAQRQVRSQKSRIKSTHDDAVELVAKNALDHAVTDWLADKAIPLHGVLRTFRAVNDTLPPELWLTSIEVGRNTGRGSRASARPVVVIKGAGRPISGRDVGQVYREFGKKFEEHAMIAGSQVTRVVDDPSEEKTLFTITVDFAPAEAGG